MPEYDLRETLARAGFDCSVDDQPVEGFDWRVVEATESEIIIRHPTGATVHLKQRKPEGGDLPFRAVRVNQRGEEHQLAEGDWIGRVLTPATAYMRGFSERGAE